MSDVVRSEKARPVAIRVSMATASLGARIGGLRVGILANRRQKRPRHGLLSATLSAQDHQVKLKLDAFKYERVIFGK